MKNKAKRERREAALLRAEGASADVSRSPAGQPSRGAVSPRRLLERPWVLPAVLGLAALLRFAHVLAMSGTPYFDTLELDFLAYDEWGQRIAAGDWMGDRPFYQDPLYPYFLGIVYSVFGRQLMLVYLLQVAIGVGTCWLTALLGRRVFSLAVGNLAGLMAALFLPSIFYEVQIEKTFLSVFLVAAFLVTVLTPRPASRFAAGLILALASLTRANLVVFVPLAALVLLFERQKSGRDSDPPRYLFFQTPDRDSLRHVGAFLAGCALIVAPVMLRNHHVGGEWGLTTSQAGQNFYIGNNPHNTTGTYNVPSTIRPHPHFEEMDFRAVAENETGRSLSAAEVSDYWSGLAWEHIRTDPDFAARMFVRKFLLFWNDYEVPDNLDMYLVERWSWVLRLPGLGFGVVASFALLGALVGFGGNARARILIGFMVLYCATVVVFFVFSRYRIQIAPILLVFAASGVLWMVQKLCRADWSLAFRGTIAVVLAGVLCFWSLDWSDKDKAIAISLNNLGAIYMQRGEPDKSIAVYEEAIALNPEGVLGAMRLLGDYYQRIGNIDRAEEHMQHVVRLRPDSRMGWNALAGLYATQFARTVGGSDLANKYAGALLSAGRFQEARVVIEQARSRGANVDEDLLLRLETAERGAG